MPRRNLRWTSLSLGCAGLLLAAAPAFAQTRTGGGSSFGSGGSSMGSSSFGSGGSSFGSSSFGSGSSFGGNSNFGGSSSSFGGSNFGGSNFGGSNFGGSNFGGSNFGGSNTGGTSFTGGTGGYPGGTTGRGAQIGATTWLGPYYANPLAMGLASGTTSTGGTTRTAAFGQPLYSVTTSTTTTGGRANVSTSSTNNAFGAGFNVRRLPSYATRLAIKDMPPPPSAGQVQAELQTMLAQSSQLDQRNAVRVAIDGPVVVLQGRVADDDERRLVENMVHLTQGVGEVRNELTTMTPAATTARAP